MKTPPPPGIHMFLMVFCLLLIVLIKEFPERPRPSFHSFRGGPLRGPTRLFNPIACYSNLGSNRPQQQDMEDERVSTSDGSSSMARRRSSNSCPRGGPLLHLRRKGKASRVMRGGYVFARRGEREEGLLFFFQHLAYLCVAAPPPSAAASSTSTRTASIHLPTKSVGRRQSVGGIGE